MRTWICISFLQLLYAAALIEATGYLEMRLIEYFNKEGRTHKQKHCDSAFFGRTSACDLYFNLRIDGRIEDSKIGPHWGGIKTRVYHNKDRVTFGGFLGSTYLNPFNLRFNNWQGYLYFHVSVNDRDIGGNDDHVDNFSKTFFNFQPNGNKIRRQLTSNYHGHNAKLTFEVSVHCDAFFYPPHCTKYCKPSNNSNGHYSCDSLGNKKCLSGWENPENDCKSQFNLCKDHICFNGGHCLNRNGNAVCNCADGFTGRVCEMHIATERVTEKAAEKAAEKATEKATKQATENAAVFTSEEPSGKLNSSEPKINVYGGVHDNSVTLNPKVAAVSEHRTASIHPAFLSIPLILIILILAGALYHQRQRLRNVLATMKVTKSSTLNTRVEVCNIYSEGAAGNNDGTTCAMQASMVREVDNNTYMIDPTQSQSRRNSEYGSLYGSITSGTDTEDDDMEDGNYNAPKNPRRYRDSSVPPQLPSRDGVAFVDLQVTLPVRGHCDDV